MTPESIPELEALRAAIAQREKVSEKDRKIAERHRSLEAAKSERDQAQAALDELMRNDKETLTEWARSGAKGTPPLIDAKARDAALRRLANATEAARAIDEALRELDEEHLRTASEMKAAQDAVRLARAHYLAALFAAITAKARQIEDEREIHDALRAGLNRLLIDADAPTCGSVTAALEKARVEWINDRNAAMQLEINRRWRELVGELPA